MNLGDTFRPTKFDSHLWIVSSKTEIDPIVLFNLTSYSVDEEDVCVLHIGEHPFITHKTTIRYWQPKCVASADLQKVIDAGQMKQHEPASPTMLRKIWLGAALSRRIKINVLEILEAQGLLPD
jgi:hypothetical protein